MWELEPEEEPIPDCHASIDGCGDRPHDECANCKYESAPLEGIPCVRCWNGNGNGDWCYFESRR